MSEQLKFNKDARYHISICVSSKVMKKERKVLFQERNVIFIGCLHDSKFKLLTFKRMYPTENVKEHFHINQDYIHLIEQL